MRAIRRVVIHQTDTPQTASNAATLIAIDRYHREVMKWSKIGYHRVIFKDGEWLKGRLDSEVGAHVAGHNADSIGICLVGKGPALPVGIGYMTAEQWATLLALCESFHRAYGVPWEHFVGHREFPNVAKSCPGFEVSELRAVLRQQEHALDAARHTPS